MSIKQRCPECTVLRDTKLNVCQCGSDELGKRKKAGTAIYWVVLKRRGKEYRKSPRDYGFDEHSYDGAVKTENLILSELDKGNTDIGKRRPKESDWTWNELRSWYLETESPEKVRSLQRKGMLLRDLCEAEINHTKIGHKRADSLTMADLRKFKEIKMNRDEWRLKTVLMAIQASHRVLRLGVENGWFPQSSLKPFSELMKEWNEQLDNIQQLNWTEVQVKAIAEHLTRPDVRFIMEIAMTTGMRVNEVCRLKWDRLSPDFAVIELTKLDTKTKRQRFVPLTPWVQKALEHWPKVSEYVFPSKRDYGKPFLYKTIKETFKDACIAAGVPYGRYTKKGGTFHHLRKFWYTTADQQGISGATLRQIVGHTTTFMEKHYRHFNSRDLEILNQQLWPKFAHISTLELSDKVSLRANSNKIHNKNK